MVEALCFAMFIIIFPSHLHSLTVRYFAYHLIGIFHVLVHSMLLTVPVLPLSLSSAPRPSCCYVTLFVPCSSQDGRGGGRGSTKILHESLCITVHIAYMLLAISCDTEIYDIFLCGTNIVGGGGGG